LAFSPDGKVLVVADDDGLHVFNPETCQKLRTLTKDKIRFRNPAFSAEGTFAIDGREPKTLQLWDTATGRPGRLLKGKDNDFFRIAPSADGKRLVSSSADNILRVWDTTTGEVLFTHRVPAETGVNCVALSPDGKTVATGSLNSDFGLSRWDVGT